MNNNEKIHTQENLKKLLIVSYIAVFLRVVFIVAIIAGGLYMGTRQKRYDQILAVCLLFISIIIISIIIKNAYFFHIVYKKCDFLAYQLFLEINWKNYYMASKVLLINQNALIDYQFKLIETYLVLGDNIKAEEQLNKLKTRISRSGLMTKVRLTILHMNIVKDDIESFHRDKELFEEQINQLGSQSIRNKQEILSYRQWITIYECILEEQWEELLCIISAYEGKKSSVYNTVLYTYWSALAHLGLNDIGNAAHELNYVVKHGGTTGYVKIAKQQLEGIKYLTTER